MIEKALQVKEEQHKQEIDELLAKQKEEMREEHKHQMDAMTTTITTHGIKQPRNPWSDGPEYSTQCPVEPGSNFTCEVTFSTEEGTLWWHAHND
ncbi:hypothetical protein FH972_012821 [Carpinus fangiana]|uniref:Plastocyanin-like domain-containing protein n=1 Tax=Carpinus fangiana TaxID=176857 RepID=A0A5N6R862_9ROSI|nr:hypothetical protein FH972_012821 [Carpinus fangiana]